MIHLRADINSVAHASRFCSALIDTYPPTSTQTRGSRSVLAPIRDASMPKLSGRYPEAVLKLSATGGRSCPGQLADRVGGDSLTRVPPPRLAAPTFGGLGMASPAYLVKLSARTASCLPRASRRSPIDE